MIESGEFPRSAAIRKPVIPVTAWTLILAPFGASYPARAGGLPWAVGGERSDDIE